MYNNKRKYSLIVKKKIVWISFVFFYKYNAFLCIILHSFMNIHFLEFSQQHIHRFYCCGYYCCFPFMYIFICICFWILFICILNEEQLHENIFQHIQTWEKCTQWPTCIPRTYIVLFYIRIQQIWEIIETFWVVILFSLACWKGKLFLNMIFSVGCLHYIFFFFYDDTSHSILIYLVCFYFFFCLDTALYLRVIGETQQTKLFFIYIPNYILCALFEIWFCILHPKK